MIGTAVRKLLITGKLSNSNSENDYHFDEQGNSTGINKYGDTYKDVNGNDISTNLNNWDAYSMYGGLDSWLDIMVERDEKLAEEDRKADEANWKENIELYLHDFIDTYLENVENLKA
jgi:hypothetical protein